MQRIFLLPLLMAVLCVPTLASADDKAVPTLLAERGKLMLDDQGETDHSTRGLGNWSRSPDDPKVWRVTHKGGHIPTAPYRDLPKHENVIVEVTFRWGELTGDDRNGQLLAIVSDLRPGPRGHKVEAWATSKSSMTKTGLVLKSSNDKGVVMDEQPFKKFEANTWYTGVLEIVGDEALFRVDGHVAYAKMPIIAGPKNKVVLFLGTTWHEVKRVRIWHATPNPKWKEIKDDVLKSRKPFTIKSRQEVKAPDTPKSTAMDTK